jgi:hypothetical protein
MISPELAASIDEATRTLVENAYAQALAIVTERRAAVAAIAEHLCEVETIEGDELDHWMAAHPAAGAGELGNARKDREDHSVPALPAPGALHQA